MIAYVLITMAQLLNTISKKASIKSGIFVRLNRKLIKINRIYVNDNIQFEFDFVKSGYGGKFKVDSSVPLCDISLQGGERL